MTREMDAVEKEVPRLQFEASDPSEFKGAIQGYVKALSRYRMLLPDQAVSSFNDIPFAPEQFAPLVQKVDGPKLTLKLRGPNATLHVSSDAQLPKNFDPRNATASAKLHYLLEGAARYQALNDSSTLKVNFPQVIEVGFGPNTTIKRLESEAADVALGRKKLGAKLVQSAAVVALAAAACTTPVTQGPPIPTPGASEVAPVATPDLSGTPEFKEGAFPLTADKAMEIINTEWGVGVGVVDGGTQFTIDSLIVDVVNTYSQVDANGQIVNPQIKRTGHLANLLSADGQTETLPLLIEYDENTGNNRVFGLARDNAKPNQFFFVTHFDGKIVRTELKLITEEEADGLSLSILNTDTGNLTVLTLTPGNSDFPTTSPTSIPDNIQWIDKLVGLISGADTAYAAGEGPSPTPPPSATNEPTKEPTTEPSSTPEPTKAPLFQECGPRPDRIEKNQSDDYPKGPDGHGLPTGLSSETRIKNQYLTMLQVAGCLTGVDGIQEGNQLSLTLGFYDTLGNIHEYPAVMGGQNPDGSGRRVSICETIGDTYTCNSIFTPEALPILQSVISDTLGSKQVYLQMVEIDNSAPWNLGEYQPDNDFVTRFYEAMKTGTDFPTLPQSNRLIVWQINRNHN